VGRALCEVMHRPRLVVRGGLHWRLMLPGLPLWPTVYPQTIVVEFAG